MQDTPDENLPDGDSELGVLVRLYPHGLTIFSIASSWLTLFRSSFVASIVRVPLIYNMWNYEDPIS